MDLKESLLKNLVLPLIVGIILLILSTFGSFVSTGNWLEWIRAIPLYVWAIFGLWFIGVLIFRRFNKIKDTGPYIGVGYYSYERHNVGELSHAGVIWRIYVDYTDPFDTYDTTKLRNFDAESTPRCPEKKCRTELDEEKSFWGGYIWLCPRCGFKIRNRNSFITESGKAAKIARSEIEGDRLKNHNR